MILGVGTDIVSIARLRRAINQNGDAFCRRAFTPEEIAYAQRHTDALPHLAGRWAAKEALAKALGTGCGGECSWRDIAIVNDDRGQPQMHLSGQTLATFESLGANRLHLSLSHETEFACAVVILEKD